MFQTLGFKWGSSATPGTTGGQVEWSTSGSFYNALPKESGYTNADFDAALVEAFDTWERVASIDFVRVNSGADISIIDDSTTGIVVGYATDPDFNNDGIADSGIVAFSNNLPGSRDDWSPYGEGGVNFFVVALHEIGHAIGLGHVEGSLQIMNSTLTGAQTTLRDGDIDGAQFLYGKDAGDVDAVEDPEVPPPSGNPSADLGGDGGGGGAGILLALLGLLAFIFGGFLGGGGAAVLAAGYEDDEDADAEDAPSDGTATDLPPMLPAGDHAHDGHEEGGVHMVRWFDDWTDIPTVDAQEDNMGHTPFGGCTCAHCHEQQLEEEAAADFLV